VTEELRHDLRVEVAFDHEQLGQFRTLFRLLLLEESSWTLRSEGLMALVYPEPQPYGLGTYGSP
jgi:hypothetical protein